MTIEGCNVNNVEHFASGIPTGFHHSAQRWSVATTLGQRPKINSTLKGLYQCPLQNGFNPFRVAVVWVRHPA